MIIGIDASKAAQKVRTGVENYVFELILNLHKIDQKNTYYLYTNKGLPKELLGKNFIEKKISVQRFWNRVFLPLAVLTNKPDVYLQPSDLIPWSAPVKSAAVVHDLASYYFPKAYSKNSLFKQKKSYLNYVKNAQKIICVSHSTEKDFAKYFPVKKSDIAVIPLGFDRELFHPTKSPKADSPYIFYSGRIEERKNIIRLVKAFVKLKNEHDIPHQLILSGSFGFGFEKIIDYIKNEVEFSADIKILGYIEREEVPKLISNAEIYASPTLYEGFGLSVLEAMACGAAIVTSKISSLPEVVGDAALLCDPLDENDIADKMYQLISDKNFRQDLQEKAIKQAQKFSWESTATQTLDLLSKLNQNDE